MEPAVVLLLQFERSGHLGETLRQTLESSTDRGFEVACHTSQEVDGRNDVLSKIIHRQKPSLILLALPCAQLKSLDALLRVLGPVASSAPIVVAVENVPEAELSELER